MDKSQRRRHQRQDQSSFFNHGNAGPRKHFQGNDYHDGDRPYSSPGNTTYLDSTPTLSFEGFCGDQTVMQFSRPEEYIPQRTPGSSKCHHSSCPENVSNPSTQDRARIVPSHVPGHRSYCLHDLQSQARMPRLIEEYGGSQTTQVNGEVFSQNPYSAFSRVNPYATRERNGQGPNRYIAPPGTVADARRPSVQGPKWPENNTSGPYGMSIQHSRDVTRYSSPPSGHISISHGSSHGTPRPENYGLYMGFQGSLAIPEALTSANFQSTEGLYPTWKPARTVDSSMTAGTTLNYTSQLATMHGVCASPGDLDNFPGLDEYRATPSSEANRSKFPNQQTSQDLSRQKKPRSHRSDRNAKPTKHHRRSFTEDEKAQISQMRRIGACEECRQAKRKVCPFGRN